MTIKKILSLRAFTRKRGNLLLIKLNFKINSITLDYFGLRPSNDSVKKIIIANLFFLSLRNPVEAIQTKNISTLKIKIQSLF